MSLHVSSQRKITFNRAAFRFNIEFDESISNFNIVVELGCPTRGCVNLVKIELSPADVKVQIYLANVLQIHAVVPVFMSLEL